MNYSDATPVRTAEGINAGAIPDWIFASEQPVVMRGLVAHWPAVTQSDGSLDSTEQYLGSFVTDKPVTAYVAPYEARGRFGYNDSFDGFNFRSGSAPLRDIFQRLREQQDPATKEPMSIYVGSTPVDGWLPGFQEHNALTVPGTPLVNFWLGNATTVSAHYDFPSNVACVVSGRRRFTLFPIDQINNLYVGPIDRTPSGQPISLVDFDSPDPVRFPRFTKALDHAQTAVLGPGDAIFIPSMWWHHVKALSDFNLLINYWWLDSADHLGSPFHALLHGVLSIRQLPAAQREAWKLLIDHYIFNDDPAVTAHIPDQALGCLGSLDKAEAERLRVELRKRLN